MNNHYHVKTKDYMGDAIDLYIDFNRGWAGKARYGNTQKIIVYCTLCAVKHGKWQYYTGHAVWNEIDRHNDEVAMFWAFRRALYLRWKENSLDYDCLVSIGWNKYRKTFGRLLWSLIKEGENGNNPCNF